MSEHTPQHRINLPIRLSHGHQRWVYTSFSLLWLSGALWLLFHYFLQAQGSFGPEPHVLEKWWLRLHGLAMMVTLSVLGSVIVHHAHRAWRLKKNALLGALLSFALGWMAVTGYAQYYFASEDNGSWLPLLHWLPGLCLPLLLAVHIYYGKVRKRTRVRTPPHNENPPQTKRMRSIKHRLVAGWITNKITPAQTADSSPQSARSRS